MPATFDNFAWGGAPFDLEVAGPRPSLIVFSLISIGDASPTTVTANGIPLAAIFFSPLQMPIVSPTFEMQLWTLDDAPIGTVTLTSDTTPLLFASAYTNGIAGVGLILDAAHFLAATPTLNQPEFTPADVTLMSGLPLVGFIKTEPFGANVTAINEVREMVNLGTIAVEEWLGTGGADPIGWTLGAPAFDADWLYIALGVGFQTEEPPPPPPPEEEPVVRKTRMVQIIG